MADEDSSRNPGDATGAAPSPETQGDPAPEQAAPADAGGGLSQQEDVDALVSGANADGSAEEPGSAAEEGELSQADIDAALSGAGAGAESAPSPDERLDSAARVFDEAAAAIEEEKAAAAAASPAIPEGEPPDLPTFAGPGEGERPAHGIDLLHDVSLRVKIELGRTRMLVEDVLKLGEGSVVELEKLAGDPVDVFANGRLIARGEVLVLNDNFCVRISEIVSGVAREAVTL